VAGGPASRRSRGAVAASAAARLRAVAAGNLDNPRLNTLKALAKALNVGLMELAENGDEPAAEAEAGQVEGETPPPKRGRKSKRGHS